MVFGLLNVGVPMRVAEDSRCYSVLLWLRGFEPVGRGFESLSDQIFSAFTVFLVHMLSTCFRTTENCGVNRVIILKVADRRCYISSMVLN